MIAGVAEEFGFAMILPLFVDVDRGGPLAQKELTQVLNEAIRCEPTLSEHGIVPLGVCGGGISAMRLAQTSLKISALVLNSPEIFRDRTRVALPDSTTDPTNRFSEFEFASSLEALSAIPVYVMFDSDLPGHGDRSGTARLITELRAFGGNVKALWPRPPGEYVWGERDRSNYRKWFAWIASVANSKRDGRVSSETSIRGDASVVTIQSALRRGFSVADTDDPLLSDFRRRWFAKLRLYRGAEPQHNVGAVATHVVFESGTQPMPSPEERSDSASGSVPVLHAPEFSIHLKPTASGYEIVVRSTNVPPDVTLPSVDLLIEGLCQEMIWRYRAKAWQLVSTGEEVGHE